MRLLLPLLLLAGCAGGGQTNGLIVTRDGRLVAETPEVARDDFAGRLADRAASAAGEGWKASATIGELPTLDAVRADEFGWKALSVALTLVPPAGADTASGQQRAEAAVREAARYRISRSTALALATTVVAPGTPPPGSQRYTAVAGDTWAGIATAFHGSSQSWRVIADANPAVELKPGVELVIPPKP